MIDLRSLEFAPVVTSMLAYRQPYFLVSIFSAADKPTNHEVCERVSRFQLPEADTGNELLAQKLPKRTLTDSTFCNVLAADNFDR